MSSNTFREQALRETAQALGAVQRQLLTNLSDRGPGLLMELAVRLLTFPERISAPLNELRERGLVRGEPFSGGQLGGELYYLTADGWLLVELLCEIPWFVFSMDCLRLQADLLEKLGDLAGDSRDFAEAKGYYQLALVKVRQLLPTCAN